MIVIHTFTLQYTRLMNRSKLMCSAMVFISIVKKIVVSFEQNNMKSPKKNKNGSTVTCKVWLRGSCSQQKCRIGASSNLMCVVCELQTLFRWRIPKTGNGEKTICIMDFVNGGLYCSTKSFLNKHTKWAILLY